MRRARLTRRRLADLAAVRVLDALCKIYRAE